MSVHKKLMQARLTLQGMKLKKSGLNKFAGYQYFELGDFIPAVQTIFNDVGLCGVISYGKEIATLTITDTEDGTSLDVTSPMSTAALKGCHEVQQLGAWGTWLTGSGQQSALEHNHVDCCQRNADLCREACVQGASELAHAAPELYSKRSFHGHLRRARACFGGHT